MRHIVGVAEALVSPDPEDTIVTHALGSCLGLAIHDPVAQVGGLLHVMLPDSSINPEKARLNPWTFVDTGVPMLFRQLYQLGAFKPRLIVNVAGGAAVQENDRFGIGKRNVLMLRKLFWRNEVLVNGEDLGGSQPRTMYLHIGTGRVWISSRGQEYDL